MFSRGPIWHSLVPVLVLVSGCYDMHGAPRDAGRDAPPFRDAWPLDVAIPSLEDTSDPCAFYVEQVRAGTALTEIGCDGRTFPAECRVDAGECCWLSLSCAIEPGDGGHVEASFTCVDSCDQTCGAQTLDDCALFPYCEPFDSGACGPAPDGVIEGPACIQRRTGPCASDADCEAGTRCRSYWVNPCAGLSCDACGGEERRCAP